MKVVDPQAGLRFGSLELLQDTGLGYTFAALGDDATFGNPQPIEEMIKSLLQDGSIVATLGYDNREANIRIRIEADDAVSLALAEKALALECGKRNELVWTPPDGWGAPTVFPVITSNLEHVFSDLDELQLQRTYGLRLICEPFSRSLNEVLTPALVIAAGAEATINDASSAASWTASGTINGSGSGSLNVSTTNNTAWLELTTAAIDMTTTPYLTVIWKTPDRDRGVSLTVDGVWMSRISETLIAGGWKRTTFLCSDSSITKIRFTVQDTRYPSFTLHVDHVSRSGSPPSTATATGRQRARLVDVAGSARTPGSLEVSHASVALGTTLIYTSPADGSGYQPSLDPWRTTAGSADPATVSGTTGLLNTAGGGGATVTYRVPTRNLKEGTYVLVARLNRNVAGLHGINVAMQTRVAAAYIGDPLSVPLTLELATNFQFYTLGTFSLPTVSVPDSAVAELEVTFSADTHMTNVCRIDDAWLFRIDDDTALTWIAGAYSNRRLWVESPTVENPEPALWIGNNADKSDAHFPIDVGGAEVVQSWGAHQFVPPATNVFVITANATDAAVTLRHHPRWHTHAVE